MYFGLAGAPETEKGDGGGETRKEDVLNNVLDEFRTGLEGEAK